MATKKAKPVKEPVSTSPFDQGMPTHDAPLAKVKDLGQRPDTELPRSFVYNGSVLEDPDSAMSPADVKTYYAQVYPELTTANPVTEIKGSGANRYREISFKKATGTKG